jgi:hypothetical protein
MNYLKKNLKDYKNKIIVTFVGSHGWFLTWCQRELHAPSILVIALLPLVPSLCVLYFLLLLSGGY